jgi:hypothetical protein
MAYYSKNNWYRYQEREKYQIRYKGKSIKIIYFSTETLKTRKAWSEIF